MSGLGEVVRAVLDETELTDPGEVGQAAFARLKKSEYGRGGGGAISMSDLPAGEAGLSSLAECERIIDEGYTTFLKVGLALAKVRDSKLYLEVGHLTFEAYCEKRWHFTRTHAYNLIEGARITDGMSAIADIPKPANLGQARELAGLEPEVAAEVMVKAAETGEPTATTIREAREEIAPKPVKVTNTTRVSEATKVERDVDLATGEIVSAMADVSDPIADAKAEASKAPVVLAGKAIERFRLAYQTVEAAGGIPAIQAAMRTELDSQVQDLWLIDLERAIESASEWVASIRRRHLKGVK